jgi:hypothetical protein
MKKEAILYILLIGIALLVPTISFAGVSLIYPDSTFTTDVNTSPPITWDQGNDYTLAESLSFAGSFATTDNDAAFTLTVSGLSGGNVTIDKLLNLTAVSSVSTYKMMISSALADTLNPAPLTLKLRFWTGPTAPTSDLDAQVEAVLDLKAALNTETSDPIAGNQVVYVQLICEYDSGTTGTDSVSIQPSSIALT